MLIWKNPKCTMPQRAHAWNRRKNHSFSITQKRWGPWCSKEVRSQRLDGISEPPKPYPSAPQHHTKESQASTLDTNFQPWIQTSNRKTWWIRKAESKKNTTSQILLTSKIVKRLSITVKSWNNLIEFSISIFHEQEGLAAKKANAEEKKKLAEAKKQVAVLVFAI